MHSVQKVSLPRNRLFNDLNCLNEWDDLNKVLKPALERRIGVDEVAHWLTVMARVFPGAPKSGVLIHDTDVKL
jgi:hypothetical protein